MARRPSRRSGSANSASARARVRNFVVANGGITPPLFTTPASIQHDGTPAAGEQLVGVDGVANYPIVSRRWLLGSTVLATTNAVTAQAGTLIFESLTRAPDGREAVSSAQVVVSAAGATPTPTPPAARTMAVGANVDGVSYYMGDHPFIDRMKTADRWRTIRKADGAQVDLADVSGVTYDSEGWPSSIPSTHERLIWIFQTHRPGESTEPFYYEAQNCDLRNSYLGRNVLTNGSYSAMSGEFSNANPHQDGWAEFNITGISPGFRIKICRRDQKALMQAGEVFNSESLARWSVYDGPVRTMNWGPTNNSLLENWADRALPSHFSYSTELRPDPANASVYRIGSRGVPLEVHVALANKLGRDLHFCIPALASDDYVAKTIAYILANLVGKLYLEYSNEVWNSGTFSAYNQCQARATALAGTKSDGNPVWNGLHYWGYRAAQVAKIAIEAYTVAGKRLQLISGLGAQFVFTGGSLPVLEGAVWAGGKPAGGSIDVPATGLVAPSDVFDTFFVAPYCGGNMTLDDPASPARSFIAGVAKDTDEEAAMARAFRQWEYGDQNLGYSGPDGPGRLPTNIRGRDQTFPGIFVQAEEWVAFAKARSMSVMCYETQLVIQSFGGVWGAGSDLDAVVAFTLKVHRRPELEGLMERFYRGLAARGIEMVAIYKHCSYSAASTGLAGFFGCLTHEAEPVALAPRYRGLQRLAANRPALTLSPAPLEIVPQAILAKVGASPLRNITVSGGRAPRLFRRNPGSPLPSGRTLSFMQEKGAYTTAGRQDYVVEVIDSEGAIKEVTIAQMVEPAVVAGSYRYWRMRMFSNTLRDAYGPNSAGGQSENINLGDIIFNDEQGAVISHGDPAAGVSGTPHYMTDSPAMAFDGNPNTHFGTNGYYPVVIQKDYGSGDGRRPFSITLRARLNSTSTAPTLFVIEASNDGSTWVTIVDRSGPYTPTGSATSDRRNYGTSGYTVPCTYPA